MPVISDMTIDPATWCFLRGIVSGMRRAHAVLLGEDAKIDVMLSESIAILERAIVVHGGRLPPELETDQRA